MTSGRPISTGKRARILADLRAGKKLAGIAREHGVSPSLVKSIRIAEGLQPVPTQEAKVAAAHARDVMLLEAHRRQGVIKMRLLEEAERLLDSMHEPAFVFAFGRNADGEHAYVQQEVPEPPLKDKQAAMISVGIAVQRALDLEKREQEGSSTARAAIIELFDRMAIDEKAASA